MRAGFYDLREIPVVDLAQAHALKAVGPKGADVVNYALDGVLRQLPPILVVRSKPCPGSRTIGKGGERVYAHYATTALGMKAVRLAFAKAEGRW